METPDDPRLRPAATATALREPRAMPAQQAFAWFAEAMRLWKRGPASFAGMAFIILVVSIVFEPIRWVGLLAATLVAPLLATGLLFACLAADRGDRPRLRHLLAILAAPRRAQLAVVAAGFVVFGAEAVTAWTLAEVNLLMPLADTSQLTAGVIVAIYSAGVAASLPVTFVPFAVLFDGESVGRAFAASWRAFTLNLPALGLLALYSLVLLMLGLATMGAGLVLALPWISAATFSAWKDIFALTDATSPPGG